jgi:FMN reductase (NADPH)/FMN reductase [NAD(P)H]
LKAIYSVEDPARKTEACHALNDDQELCIVNEVLQTLLSRKSVRKYEDRPITEAVKQEILSATLRAPTAGNMMLYSIIDVTEQSIKDTLTQTCDDQSFIAEAPMVWLFVADYQRWLDYFRCSDVAKVCLQREIALRRPDAGDLLLACCDALIAAQTAVIAAEALGVGSCYIGDILEKYEVHRELFGLPDYVIPIALLCFGYPTQEQQQREQTSRFDQRFVFFENCYQRLSDDDFAAMFGERQAHWLNRRTQADDIENFGQLMYFRKYAADFSRELNRSARVMVQTWTRANPVGSS